MIKLVSQAGYIDGLTATGIILSCVIFGLLSFYQSRKLGARLLAYAGLDMILIGLFWLGPFVDFLLLFFTGQNIDPIHYYAWLSYVWIWPAVIVGFYIGSELMIPNKKKVIVGFYAILGFIFDFLIFTDPYGTFEFTLAPYSGDTIDANFMRGTLPYLLILFFQFSTLVFLCIGFAVKAKQATGDIRKRFSYLSLAFLIFFICGIFDSTVTTPIAIGLVRGVMMTFSIWMYIGLKT